MSNKYQTKLSRTCFFFKQQINTWNIKKNPGAQFNFGDCYNHTSIARASIRRCVRKIKHREFSLLVASMRRWMEWQKLKREPSSVFFSPPFAALELDCLNCACVLTREIIVCWEAAKKMRREISLFLCCAIHIQR